MTSSSKLFALFAFALIAGAAFGARAEDQAGYPPQMQIEARQIHATHSLRNLRCPPEAAVAAPVMQHVIAPPVLFASGSDKLTPATKASVKKVAALLKNPAHKGLHVLVSGYTDNKGKEASNQRLSHHRAVAVMKELVKDGVAASQVTAQGFGQENPAASNATPEGRALNRRVTFTLEGKK